MILTKLSIYLISKLSLACSALLISGIVLLGDIPMVQAEPYIRVRKNGIVYYYFSDRESKSTKQLSTRAHRPARIICPQNRNKLSHQELEKLVQEASRCHNLPPSLVKAVIRVESNFNPSAISPKGAQGLMQLMPQTAEQLQVNDPYDIRENIFAGTRYLRMLLERFDNRLPLALAAYNAGPQRVNGLQIPPIIETREFVRNVCANFLKYAKEPPPLP
jgi:soluble lytic murein transglycosylase-like protein